VVDSLRSLLTSWTVFVIYRHLVSPTVLIVPTNVPNIEPKAPSSLPKKGETLTTLTTVLNEDGSPSRRISMDPKVH